MIKFLGKNKLLTLFIFVFLALIGYFFWLNRMPFTDNAFVVANIRPVSAEAAGPITHIYVENNHRVKRGDPLFTVFKRPYELAALGAARALEENMCRVKAIKEKIRKKRFVIEQREAECAYDRYLARIVDELAMEKAEPVVHAKALAEKVKVAASAIKVAKAALNESLHELQEAEVKTKRLEADLERKKIKLEQTTVYAKSDGIISNMFMSEGIVASEGVALFAFVDTEKWWVQANFKETVLQAVKPGMKVSIVFPMYPDRTFQGVVGQIGWNVNRQRHAGNALPVVEKENEWFLLPQRFPVQILLHDLPSDVELHVGQSADVHIHTGRWEFPPIR